MKISDKSRGFYPIDMNGKITVQDLIDTISGEVGSGGDGSFDETITNEMIDSKITEVMAVIDENYVPKDMLGAPGGFTPLGPDNKVPSIYLPEDASAPRIAALESAKTEQDSLINFINDKVDNTAANTLVLDARLKLVEGSGGSSGSNSTAIIELQNKDIELTGKIGNVEDALISKANLVDGKVPYEQLPSFPVGRKIKVANAAERLALSTHTDLTIAYEQDTADAWALNPNDDPSVPANWSKLGNTQAVGVVSFNGRIGNVGPEPNDYNTDQIVESVNKFFVTPSSKASWDSKETTTGSQAKADAASSKATADAKAYADNTFIPTSQKGVPSGVASLDSSGKVPVANLLTNVAGGVALLNSSGRVPYQHLAPARVWRNVLTSRSIGVWYTNTSPLEREVHIFTTRNNNAGYITVEMQEDASSELFRISGNTTQDYSGLNTRCFINITIPSGWRYAVSSSDFGSRVLQGWYELS